MEQNNNSCEELNRSMSLSKPTKQPAYRRPSIKDKINIIQRSEAGESNKSLAKEYHVNPSTITNILKNKENLRQKYDSVKDSHGSQSYSAVHPQLEKVVFQWFIQKRSQNQPISGPLLKEKALLLNTMLGGPQDFRASNGWIDKFKRRHGITQKLSHGEKLSADFQASEEFVKFFKTYIVEEGYDLDAVYNADETGVYWRSLPRESLVAEHEKTMSGFKTSKDRVTAMVCGNATGTHALPLLAIGKSNKPRCFKNVRHLPVTYRGQKSAWISREIFIEWFKTVFLTSVKERIGKKKFLLLLDNAPTHPSAEFLNGLDEMCEVMYLPPNVTSVIQPMDQGVIVSMKRHYKKNLLRELLLQENDCVETFCRSLNMLKCCESLAKAWNSVTPQTLRNAWKKLEIPDEVSVENTSELVANNMQYCVREACGYVNRVAGLQDWTVEDTVAWLDEDSSEFGWGMLSDEQLINNEYEVTAKTDENSDNDDSESSDVNIEEEPTCRLALRSLDTFTNWYRTQWDSEPNDFLAIRKMRKVAEDAILN